MPCCAKGLNVGTTGVGVFKSSSCNTLKFRKLTPSTTNPGITIVENVPNCNIEIGVVGGITEPTTCSLSLGSGALAIITSGINDTALGQNALAANTTGNDNTAVGCNALNSNSTGNSNIALGSSAGSALTTTSNNIAIGHTGVVGDSGIIRLGTPGTQVATHLSGEVVTEFNTAAGTDAGVTIPEGTTTFTITVGTESAPFPLTPPGAVTGQLLFVRNDTTFATTGLVVASSAGASFFFDGTSFVNVGNS